MLRRTVKHGDVSRETKQWKRERDAIARAVGNVQEELRAQRARQSIDRALARWQKLTQ